jgi:hypothetical protein
MEKEKDTKIAIRKNSPNSPDFEGKKIQISRLCSR